MKGRIPGGTKEASPVRVKDIMTTPVITTTPGTHVKEIAALLLAREISAVPVVDEHDDLVGIVSEDDLMRLETEPDPRSHARPSRQRERPVPRTATEIMTRRVITLPPDADVADAARLMLSKRIKRVPIVEGRRVVGIVSRHDVLKVLARPDSDIRRELEELLTDEITMLGRFDIEVEDGVVTLRDGLDAESRRLAELLSRSVPGVTAVRFEDA